VQLGMSNQGLKMFPRMNLTDELERLSALHAKGSLNEEEFTKAKQLLLSGKQFFGQRCIRRQSMRQFCGLPLWAVATGPDP